MVVSHTVQCHALLSFLLTDEEKCTRRSFNWRLMHSLTPTYSIYVCTPIFYSNGGFRFPTQLAAILMYNHSYTLPTCCVHVFTVLRALRQSSSVSARSGSVSVGKFTDVECGNWAGNWATWDSWVEILSYCSLVCHLFEMLDISTYI